MSSISSIRYETKKQNVSLKPRPHQQQCRSNRQHCRSNFRRCRSNTRLCCHKHCRTFIVKFRPFDNVECCLDIVAVFGDNVERNYVLSTKSKQIEHVQFVSTLSVETTNFCSTLLPKPVTLLPKTATMSKQHSTLSK